MLPAIWIATIRTIRIASRFRNGSSSDRSRRRKQRPRPPRSRCRRPAGIVGRRRRRTRRRTGSRRRRRRLRRFPVDAAVDLDRPGAHHLAQAPDLVGRVGDEGLAAPAGVDRHAEKDVGVVHGLANRRDRGARVDGQAGQAAELADGVQRAIDVRSRLGVEGDVVGARPWRTPRSGGRALRSSGGRRLRRPRHGRGRRWRPRPGGRS